jgi:hypothetical protein
MTPKKVIKKRNYVLINATTKIVESITLPSVQNAWEGLFHLKKRVCINKYTIP